jgi:hypothetical protein
MGIERRSEVKRWEIEVCECGMVRGRVGDGSWKLMKRGEKRGVEEDCKWRVKISEDKEGFVGVWKDEEWLGLIE